MPTKIQCKEYERRNRNRRNFHLRFFSALYIYRNTAIGILLYYDGITNLFIFKSEHIIGCTVKEYCTVFNGKDCDVLIFPELIEGVLVNSFVNQGILGNVAFFLMVSHIGL